MNEKEKKLGDFFRRTRKLAIAFSGGTDSTTLAKFAKVSGCEVLLVHALSPFVPSAESEKARKFADDNGIRMLELQMDPLLNEDISRNPPDRCYHCKKMIFAEIVAKSRKKGFELVADGSNLDDLSDFRPGNRACAEMKIIHPLAESGFYKKDVRKLAKRLGLDNWDTPENACLATRIPVNVRLDANTLSKVEKAETLLKDLGLDLVRVRVFGDLACIETSQENFPLITASRKRILDGVSKLGFSKVCLNLSGYQKGSMNQDTKLSGFD